MTAANRPVLGRLEPLALREVWPHEAHDFTPWLLENADVLGEALDMDLEITSAEHPVGGYALDLVGRDLHTDDRVIIENQLETTDHAHLGQLLTYAAGTDAVNVVWVAQRFREEHRAALDWLNAHTDPETRFFGVEVTAVRIGDSVPAPLFRLVAEPNDWGKSVKTRTRTQGSEGAKSLHYTEFWELYIAAAQDAGLSGPRKSPRENWFPTSSAVPYVTYTVAFTKRGLQSEVYFEHRDPDVNTARFERLRAVRPRLEAAYGGPLSFEPLDTRKGCRIADLREGSILDLDAWSSYITWFIDTQTRLRAAITAVGGTTPP